jgi:hypothetical protein
VLQFSSHRAGQLLDHQRPGHGDIEAVIRSNHGYFDRDVNCLQRRGQNFLCFPCCAGRLCVRPRAECSRHHAGVLEAEALVECIDH